jgi:hypothetical protein
LHFSLPSVHSFVTPGVPEFCDLRLIWIMDDDYVAKILAKEAKESSIKYASQGMSAFMPSRSVCSHGPRFA